MQVIRYRENASSPWKEALMATAFTEGSGGGSGDNSTLGRAVITSSKIDNFTLSFDISNYLTDKPIYVFFTYDSGLKSLEIKGDGTVQGYLTSMGSYCNLFKAETEFNEKPRVWLENNLLYIEGQSATYISPNATIIYTATAA